ncbi:MAG: DUF4861 domain-containing protein [Thermoflexibacter sp.]|jgi:hypothetical protein|nr:DUF4861 domain-containing protein [Thermoflexibacter sp.]
MKMYKIYTLLFGFLLLPFLILGQEKSSLTISNPLGIRRIDEVIVLNKKQIEKKSGKISQDKLPLFTNQKGEVLPSQTDDLDGDGKWDEAVFLASFESKETYKVSISWVKIDEFPKFAVRTQARMAKLQGTQFMPITKETMPEGHKPTDFSTTKMPLYQVEGVAWENDKVGFRLYFDQRNGKDIFGKTTKEMILQNVGLPNGDYHTKSDWGMDILKVGASLGAGSVAIVSKNADGKETLVRLGENVGKTSYELVTQGAVRSIFRLKYENWKVADNQIYNVIDEVSITAGKYFYESKLTISGFSGERALATGIVNLYSDKSNQINQKKYSILSTHAKQSENKDMLGMGVIIDQSIFAGFGETPEVGAEKVLQTYFVKMKATENQPITYRFYAGWEASDSRFAQATFFAQFLEEEGEKKSNPIKIKY